MSARTRGALAFSVYRASVVARRQTRALSTGICHFGRSYSLATGTVGVHPALGVYLQALLRRIETADKQYQPSRQTFVELAHLLLFTQGENYRQLEKLQSARQSTRVELLRRLEQGRSYLLDHWNEEVPLTEVAQVAQLSPYHFHRRWREAFGETPRQFVERLRIEHACQMLRMNRFTITEIALQCGFSDLAAFSNVFKKRMRKSPRQWRG